MSLFRKMGWYYLAFSLVLCLFLSYKMYSSFRTGKPVQEALDLFKEPHDLEKIVNSTPGNYPAAKIGLGVLYQKKGDYASALRVYEEALANDPSNADAWFRLGTLHMERHDWQKAADAYERCLKLRPDSPHAHNDLALAYDQMERYEDALKEYEAAVRLDPDPILQENLNQARYDFERRSKEVHVMLNDPAVQAPVQDPGILIDTNAPIAHEATASFRRPQKVFLKNGRSVKGDIIQKDEEGLWLEAANNVRTHLRREEIDRIEEVA